MATIEHTPAPTSCPPTVDISPRHDISRVVMSVTGLAFATQAGVAFADGSIVGYLTGSVAAGIMAYATVEAWPSK